MTSERKRIFTRSDLWAILFLLACLILGGALMIYQKSHRKLPPKLLIETVQAKQIENHKYSNLTSNPRAESSDLKININTAPADSLELLPGIGPVYAERIVEHRNENGYFHSLSDLSRIKGIGPGTVEKIASFIVLE